MSKSKQSQAVLNNNVLIAKLKINREIRYDNNGI